MQKLIQDKVYGAESRMQEVVDLLDVAARLSLEENREGEKELRADLYRAAGAARDLRATLALLSPPKFPVGSLVRRTKPDLASGEETVIFEVIGHKYNQPGNWTAWLRDVESQDPLSVYGGVGEVNLIKA
jgi:hypothetical protein